MSTRGVRWVVIASLPLLPGCGCDEASLVGTVLKGRLTALFQAIAGFFRRLFRRRSAG